MSTGHRQIPASNRSRGGSEQAPSSVAPSALTSDDFKQPLHFVVLFGLSVSPISDQLLFLAHVLNHAVDRLRQIGHGVGGSLAGSGLGDNFAHPVERIANFRAHAAGGPSRPP